MRAAAQFDREVLFGQPAHAEHADFVTILLAEQRHRARLDRFFGRHQPRRDRLIGADFGVHFGFNRRNVLGSQSGRLREIETQPVGRDQRALLCHMRAQPVAQRGVEQVRGRMVGADRIAALDVDRQPDGIAHLDRSRLDHRLLRVEPPQRLRSIVDAQLQFGVIAAWTAGDHARIAALAAAFAIERRLVGEHHDAFARACAVDFLAVAHQRDDLAFALGCRVAGEFGGAEAVGQIEPDFARSRVAAALPSRARRRLLPRHRRIEPGTIDRDAARTQRIFGQVIRKSEGIVELERGFTGQFAAVPKRFGRLVEQPQAIGQGLAEARFLA